MQRITTFNEVTLGLVRRDLNLALKQIKEQYGVNLSPAGIHIRYSPNSATVKIELTIPEATASIKPTGDLKQYVGKYYKMKRRIFHITGVQDGKLAGTTQNGKGYLLTEQQVMAMAPAPLLAIHKHAPTMHSRYRSQGGQIEG